jgi:hypothetical protein
MDIIFQIGETERTVGPFERFRGGTDAYVRRVKEVHIMGQENEKQVAALRLPAGHWVVFAKANLQSDTPVGREVDARCLLKVSSADGTGAAESTEDITRSSLTPVARVGGTQDVYHYETTTLLLGAELKDGGYAQWVGLDISQHRKQVLVVLDHGALEPPLPDMAA